MSLPKTSKVLDKAAEIGFTVSYDEDCGTSFTGLVTICGGLLGASCINVEVRCAENEGLCFVPGRSSYGSLTDTMCALGIVEELL